MDSKIQEKGQKMRIKTIKKELGRIGPFISGSMTEQYNVCGTSGCKCKDPKNPLKHGPYYQLSYYHKKKHSTLFIPKYMATDIKNRVKNYKKFKAVMEEWSNLEINSTLNTIRSEKQRKQKKPKT